VDLQPVCSSTRRPPRCSAFHLIGLERPATFFDITGSLADRVGTGGHLLLGRRRVRSPTSSFVVVPDQLDDGPVIECVEAGYAESRVERVDQPIMSRLNR